MTRKVLEIIGDLYSTDTEKMIEIPGHEGGRNIVYHCGDKVIRISALSDRTYEDFLAETEYIHYLAEGGASVADVIPSAWGRMVEKIEDENKLLFVSAFEIAQGDQLAEHGYRYREGVPLSEYFFNCGKTLGKIHALSKEYHPVHKRFDFFDKYNEEYFNQLIPDDYSELKDSLFDLLKELRNLPRNICDYGMVHFDFSDGNYMIDYHSGKITAFDFDSCRTCWYLFDLANLWTHGVGWISYEPDAEKRRDFMEGYFEKVLEGYRLETEINSKMLEQLPLIIQTVLMENIIDKFEVQKVEGKTFELDAEQAYKMACLTKKIPFMGFFDEIFSCASPFEIEI